MRLKISEELVAEAREKLRRADTKLENLHRKSVRFVEDAHKRLSAAVLKDF
jgi:molecular chaperone GrpE (heat shock protein)